MIRGRLDIAKPATRFGRLDIARRNGRPAHEAFTGMVTASLIREHGSYEAARKALDSMNSPTKRTALIKEG